MEVYSSWCLRSNGPHGQYFDSYKYFSLLIISSRDRTLPTREWIENELQRKKIQRPLIEDQSFLLSNSCQGKETWGGSRGISHFVMFNIYTSLTCKLMAMTYCLMKYSWQVAVKICKMIWMLPDIMQYSVYSYMYSLNKVWGQHIGKAKQFYSYSRFNTGSSMCFTHPKTQHLEAFTNTTRQHSNAKQSEKNVSYKNIVSRQAGSSPARVCL